MGPLSVTAGGKEKSEVDLDRVGRAHHWVSLGLLVVGHDVDGISSATTAISGRPALERTGRPDERATNHAHGGSGGDRI